MSFLDWLWLGIGLWVVIRILDAIWYTRDEP